MISEEFNPNAYQIPCKLTDRYKGEGYAIAAIDDNGRIADFFYIAEYIPEFDVDDDGTPGISLPLLIVDPRLAVPVNSLIERGEISLGMMGSWEFVAL